MINHEIDIAASGMRTESKTMTDTRNFSLLKIEMIGAVARITICRAAKRNALSDLLVAERKLYGSARP